MRAGAGLATFSGSMPGLMCRATLAAQRPARPAISGWAPMPSTAASTATTRPSAMPAIVRYVWETCRGRCYEPDPEQRDQGDRGHQAGVADGLTGRGRVDALGLQRAHVHQRARRRSERGQVADEEAGQDDVRHQAGPHPRPEGGQNLPVEQRVAAERGWLRPPSSPRPGRPGGHAQRLGAASRVSPPSRGSTPKMPTASTTNSRPCKIAAHGRAPPTPCAAAGGLATRILLGRPRS